MTRLRKPVTRQADASGDVDWGVNPDIVVTLYPAGAGRGSTIGLKEAKRSRKTELVIEVGRLYGMLLRWKINGERLALGKARADARKLRKQLR